jgi:hypothetical protein
LFHEDDQAVNLVNSFSGEAVLGDAFSSKSALKAL